MKGLAIIDRDLVLSGGNYHLRTGVPRVRQDLAFAIKEEYGSDPFHPYWGSILDRFLGQPVTAGTEQQVADEVKRVLNNYIAVQADQVSQSVTYGVNTKFSTADVVKRIESVNVEVVRDSITVTAVLQTMANDTVTVTRTVST